MARFPKILGGLFIGGALVGITGVLLQAAPRIHDRPTAAPTPSWGTGIDPELEAKRREADAIKDKDFGTYGWISKEVSPPTDEVPKPSLNSPEQRRAYAKRIERNLLSIGTSADVFIEDGPQLTISMYLSKALVYQLVTQSPILQDALNRGFKKVLFSARGSGTWFFDLSNGIPSCDTVRKLCV